MNNDQWLKSQCNKYVNGVCSTLSCLKRGLGSNRKNWTLPIDFDKSTCESHEILLELESLRNDNGFLEDEIHAECMEFAYGSHGQG